ncbi:iron chelate uptake ABC transporter family permease subunit [Rhodopseudomonas palustris]|uniref:iron chelate uptake ABC transporter family permease subunit n=1 Tax=Rhodopseudomonas palustris TaxID=1076 RepID=UPI00115CA60B|nr:iron chelate uptake ABC transporter family permease subunit [Rhodopseudomonas palustris]QDL97104.1 iron chelate uptake ABC transporter family permease subunit [Rhodopseudomonas palustris]
MRDRSTIVLAALGLIALACMCAFMTLGLRGNLWFSLELRSLRLLALVVVAVSIAVSTVVFQTVTANRILTPSIMGLDALYIFSQSLLVFTIGGFGFASLDPRIKFAGEAVVMVALAALLFLPLLKARVDLILMLLAGVTVGVLFRSLSSLLARLIDPNDFVVLQGASYANFSKIHGELLVAAGVLMLIGIAIVWRMRHTLDVLALGRDAATGLGLEWPRVVAATIMLVAALVAVSTALVGPVAFFGLLVVALGERLIDTRRHALLLPAAALVAIIVLVGGQTILQHVLGGASTLGVVIEFVGGLVFLAMLLHGARR